jgi:hypothetical protein
VAASRWRAFDPNAPGVCSFDPKLVPRRFDGDTLEAKMNVDVAAAAVAPEPSTIALAVGRGLVLLFAHRRGRKQSL